MRYFLVFIISTFFSVYSAETRLRGIFENDAFFNTDRYYTGGFKTEYWGGETEYSKKMNSYLPFDSCTSDSGYSFGQQTYTSKNILFPELDRFDRPYTAYLFIGKNFAFHCDKNQFVGEVDFGVTGNAALGKEAQSFFHHMVHSPVPQGWSSQSNGKPVLQTNIEWRHGFNKYLQSIAFTKQGNLFSSIGGGFTLRLGNSKQNLTGGFDVFQSGYPTKLESGEYFFYFQPVVWYQAYDETIQTKSEKNFFKKLYNNSNLNDPLVNDRIGTLDTKQVLFSQNETQWTRFVLFQYLYGKNFPVNLGENYLLFNTLVNYNLPISDSNKQLIGFLLKDSDIKSLSPDSQLFIFLNMNNQNGDYSQQIKVLGYKIYKEEIVKDSSFNFATYLASQELLNKDKSTQVTINRTQGKANFGFQFGLTNSLSLGLGATIASLDFVSPTTNVPYHQWGSVQLAYIF